MQDTVDRSNHRSGYQHLSIIDKAGARRNPPSQKALEGEEGARKKGESQKVEVGSKGHRGVAGEGEVIG